MTVRITYDQPDRWNGLCIVGEAPGEQEAAAGRPFVGRSGQLLDRMLVEAGIQRSECWVGNAFRTRPPNNRIAAYFGTSERIDQTYSRLPPFDGRQLHLEHSRDVRWLRRQLHKQQPRVIVTLGRTALWAVTGQCAPLKSVVGVVQAIDTPAACSLLPLWHPSYLLQYGAEHIPQQIHWLQLLHQKLRLDAELQIPAQIVGED